MAYDKVVDSSALTADLTSVANAIRSKGGTSASLAFPSGFVDAISKIEVKGASTIEYREITIASDITGSGNVTSILTNNQFIKDNYSKSGFFVLLLANPDTPKMASGARLIFHGNRLLADGVSSSNGITYIMNTAATGIAGGTIGGAINGTTWNLGFRATSAGALNLYTPSGRNIAAGSYRLYLVCEG